MNKKSFVTQIIVYMAILILLLVSVLVGHTLSSYTVLINEIRQGTENFLQVYGGEMKNRVLEMDKVLKNLMYQNNSELQILKSSNESKRFYAAQNIFNFMRDLMLNEKSVDCLVVADSLYGICLDAQSTQLTYWDRAALRAFTMDSTDKQGLLPEWNFITLNGVTYLYKMYVYNGRGVAAFTTTANFLKTIPQGDYGDQIFVLTDEQGIIEDFPYNSMPSSAKGEHLDKSRPSSLLVSQYVVADGQIMLCSMVKDVSVWNQTRVSMVVVLAVIVMTILFGFLLIRYIQREMIHPISRMAKSMRRVDEGEYTLRINDVYGSREFTHLKDSFNKLMDEIVGLKIQAYEKIIQLKDAELKSIRLQIQPHFFLNAITTLLWLGSKGKDEQTRAFVDALSKNIRYMLKSSLHTVTAAEEINHVENYFAMQEFRYPNCTFHYIEMPPELGEWRIPQMLIQTFIENEYKHAVTTDSVLTILIKLSRISHQGEDMLLIEIEDNGKGYPDDVLLYMNGQEPRAADDGQRVGLWSIKCTMELMYERSDLITLSNIKPHGCLSRIMVPAAPVHEIRTDECKTS